MPPPGLVTEKVSIRHWVERDTLTPAAASSPNVVFPIESVDVLGPAMLKAMKSRRSWIKREIAMSERVLLIFIYILLTWHMLSPHGQMVAEQAPAVGLPTVK